METIDNIVSSTSISVDEKLQLLVSRMEALKKELQSWSDWANEKVMQVTSQLSKDRVELKMLRQEKDEAEKYMKEKQKREEDNIKKLSMMENAWYSLCGQAEYANSTLLTLEAEHSILTLEAEAAKSQALESARSLEEAMRREQEALKNAQSWGLTRRLLQEQLIALKREAADLKRQVEKVECRFKQIEGQLKKEEKELEEALSKSKLIRARTEQLEALMKKKEEKMIQNAERDFEKCREDIRKLETQIRVLKSESESSKIAALRASMGMDYGNVSLDNKSATEVLGMKSQTSNNRSPVFCDNFGAKSVEWERECIMCLSEDRSVVFLPCAHQVLCTECNVQHEKQGTNECPSCRRMIQTRIQARFANS